MAKRAAKTRSRAKTPGAATSAERQRQRDEAFAVAVAKHDAREQDAEARGIPHGTLAELERAEAMLRRCYERLEYPQGDKFDSTVAGLATWGYLAVNLDPSPTPSKEVRRIAQRAEELQRNLRLWRAACHLRGIRTRGDENCEDEVRAILRALYGGAGDTVGSLEKALGVLGKFGGGSTAGTPIGAVAAALRWPKRPTRKSLGQELRRLLALPGGDPARQELEDAIEALTPEQQAFVRGVYGPGGSYKNVQRRNPSGRRLGMLRRAAAQVLIRRVPRLLEFVAE